MINFAGEKILVVGGSSGIGFATARLAAQLGAAVTIASRSKSKVEAAAAKIDGVVGRGVDVTNEAAVEQFFKDGTVWSHVVVTGSDVKIAAVRTLPLADAAAS